MSFPYRLKSAHGDIPAGTRVQCTRNAERDIVCTLEDGRELVLSGAVYCLMGEGVESQLWWRAAVRGLARVTGRSEEDVLPPLRNLLYSLQVSAGRARERVPWSEKVESLMSAWSAWHRVMWSVIDLKRNGKIIR